MVRQPVRGLPSLPQQYSHELTACFGEKLKLYTNCSYLSVQLITTRGYTHTDGVCRV